MDKNFFKKIRILDGGMGQQLLAKGLISNYKGEITFDLPYGNYVIAGIHDLDNNGVLTGNFIGIPKEPFGFSNNKRGNFGPPNWEDVLIKFNESNKKILINLKGI